MEIVYALAIGVLAGSGVWLLLRPRTFQVLMGLTLLSYATNIFIFGMGRLALHKAPVIEGTGVVDPTHYADPVPQALVLTAIVISFGTTALLLALAYRSWLLTSDDEVADDVEDRLVGASDYHDVEVADETLLIDEAEAREHVEHVEPVGTSVAPPVPVDPDRQGPS
jgi:multicomponent K+:H+ antiporter subunit C